MKKIDIDNLVSKVDIVDIISNFSTLVKTGASYKTLCNVHGDTSPSLSINPKKQIYKCFVCDHGGNTLDYLIWSQKFSFNQAIEYLVNQSGENIEDYQSIIYSKRKYNDKQLELINSLNDAMNLFNYYLNVNLDEKNELTQFISKRKLNKQIINKFKIGFAPKDNQNQIVDSLVQKGHEKSTLINASILSDNSNNLFFSNRIIFPIFDEDNNTIAFGARKMNNEDDSPKYLNSKESLVFKKSNTIYNYNKAKNFETIYIVEGFMDVIALDKAGIENAVALMGISLSNELINKLKKHKEIIIFLDNDQAGINATLKLIKIFIENDINLSIVNNKENKDPDEILNNQSKDKLLEILNSKIKLSQYIFDIFFNNIEKDNFDLIKKRIIEVSKYYENFDDFKKLEIIKKISIQFDIDKNIIINYFEPKTNVIQLKDNKQIENQNKLEKKKEPLNINKILISIWQNPIFLKMVTKENIYWPKAEYVKMYEEIKNFHENKIPLSRKVHEFIRDKEKQFNSKSSLPNNEEQFNELLSRTKNESINLKSKFIDELIDNTNDENQKTKLLETKLELLSNKKKGH